MIDTDNRSVPGNSIRDDRDEWLADLARTARNRDVYAEKRDTNAYGAPGVLRSREADMADRYEKNRYGPRDPYYGAAAATHAQPPQDDEYYEYYHDGSTTEQAVHSQAAHAEVDDQSPEWTYDEQRDLWVDRHGNPYVEAYAEGEEDRYAPAGDDYLAPQAEPRLAQRKSRGGAVSLAALVLVASIGGGLAYAWKKGGFIGSDLPGIGSAPPVIKASTDPIKIKPTETVAANDQPSHEIFDRSTPTAPANERVVRHEEQPVAIVPVRTDAGAPAASTAVPDATRPVTTSEITLPPSDAVATPDQTAMAGSVANVASNDVPTQPRQVRTVKIMPDNSVVTGEAPITAAPAAPSTDGSPVTRDIGPLTGVPPQTVPTPASPPTASVPTSQAATAGQPSADADAAAPPAQIDAIAPVRTAPVNTFAAIPDAAAPPVSPTTNDDASATTVAEPAPRANVMPPAVPPVRPRNIPKTTQVTTQVASAEPAATVAPSASASASGSAYVVQVSSQKSAAEAQAAFQALQRKYPAVLGSLRASIRKVDLPDRGTYFRVRVGSWGSSNEAGAFCAKLKAAGGDCVIARN